MKTVSCTSLTLAKIQKKQRAILFSRRGSLDFVNPQKKNSSLRIARSYSKWSVTCDLGGARTLDPLIKSQLLYQLSYEVNPHSGESSATSFLNCDAKVQLFLNNASVCATFFLPQSEISSEMPLATRKYEALSCIDIGCYDLGARNISTNWIYAPTSDLTGRCLVLPLQRVTRHSLTQPMT